MKLIEKRCLISTFYKRYLKAIINQKQIAMGLFLNSNIRDWYKYIHILTASIWLGSVLCVILIYFNTNHVNDIFIIRNNNVMMEKIDYWLIIPSSVLCYFSGLVISWKTNWGFFKYKWIVVKLIIGSLLMLFGIFFLNIWIVESSEAITNNIADYKKTQLKLGISMIVQSFFIICLIGISSIKPWGKINKK